MDLVREVLHSRMNNANPMSRHAAKPTVEPMRATYSDVLCLNICIYRFAMLIDLLDMTCSILSYMLMQCGRNFSVTKLISVAQEYSFTAFARICSE